MSSHAPELVGKARKVEGPNSSDGSVTGWIRRRCQAPQCSCWRGASGHQPTLTSPFGVDFIPWPPMRSHGRSAMVIRTTLVACCWVNISMSTLLRPFRWMRLGGGHRSAPSCWSPRLRRLTSMPSRPGRKGEKVEGPDADGAWLRRRCTSMLMLAGCRPSTHAAFVCHPGRPCEGR